MKISNSEKYCTIVEQEKSILNAIKGDLQHGQKNTVEHFEKIQSALAKMQYSKKQIEAIDKIKNVINSVLDAILNAQTIEELNTLRKSLNNEISKVRRVLSKNDNFDMNETEQHIADIRRTISFLYRNKKRDVSSIGLLLENEDNLSKEDKQLLAKKLKNENAYIKRFNNSKNNANVIQTDNITNALDQENDNETVIENESAQAPEQDELIETTDEMSKIDNISISSELNEEKVPENSLSNILSDIDVKTNEPDYYEFLETDEEFKKRTIKDCMRYEITEPIMYGKNPIQNIVSFFRNIPIYRRNQRNFCCANFDLAYYTSFRGTEMARDYLYDATRLKSILYRMFFHRNYDYSKSKYAKEFAENVEYIRALLRSNELQAEYSLDNDFEFEEQNDSFQRTL